MVLEMGLPERVGVVVVALAEEVGVEEQGADFGGEGGVGGCEEGFGGLQEGGARLDEEELGECGGEGGEGAEGRGTAGFERDGGVGDEGFDVAGCDVVGEALDKAAGGRGEVGFAGVEDLDWEGGFEGDADVEDGVGEGVEGGFAADHDDALGGREEGLTKGGEWLGVFGLGGVSDKGEQGHYGTFDVVV